MRIRYDNTIEDLVSFNRYHCDRSPTVQRERVMSICVLAVAGFAPSVLLGAAHDNTLMGIIVGLVVGGGAALIAVPLHRWRVDRQARKLYAEGANKATVGPHELELVAGELIERTPLGESRVRLEVIERVVSENEYTFVYVGALQAAVIPHGAVSEGDLNSFIAALKGQMPG
jgi:hypothetical protein